MKIMVLEDDVVTATNLSEQLEAMECEVSCVRNFLEAVTIARVFVPQILFADIHLENPINGIQVAEELKREYPNLLVVFLTAHSEQQTIVLANKTKPISYLVKPFHFNQIKAVIGLAKVALQKTENPAFDSFFLPGSTERKRIICKDLLYIEADKGYCQLYQIVHGRVEKTTSTLRLNEILELLPTDNFIQVHRSYIVNLNQIESLKTKQLNVFFSAKNIPISETFKKTLEERLPVLKGKMS